MGAMELDFAQVCFQYLRLIRFYNHTNFLIVAFGAFTLGGSITYENLKDLLVLYFSFNIGLYGGIYALNAVSDAEDDARNPNKRDRPIPSGAVSVEGALVFITFLWTFAFISSFVYFETVDYILYYLAFILVNIAYSFYLKQMKYIRFFSAAITSPLRLHMGALITNTSVPLTAAIIVFCFMACVQCTKTRLEKKLQFEVCNGWPPMYLEALCLVVIAGCMVIQATTMQPAHHAYLTISGSATVVFIGASHLSSSCASVLIGADVTQKPKNV
mmetsp:Transcript_10941/g.15171  ORF Transcript_10941/g.15171 Transcript_10941/m.15171 type:complete len:272 (+) Transcript_10941:248-1063(+)|eukprot:CAMPEP_0185253708 /NCGR_PEP_ID=MMETSP1359-20130426/2343_1 /TAXON_ID=552665 /ORGANISM="Bigelowiella longifila, Strain CCMP242" /LENGTH=271 /DNA_ID=CAMNT_0027836125 /DNA_START=85 /DNA_END=900 /DNA_ORIENTATION=-